MKGGTNCAECGSAYPPHEKDAKNAKKQWSDNSIATQLKDVFKEIVPSLPEVVQEKLKTSFPGSLQPLEAPKPTFLAQQQAIFQMNQKIEKQSLVATQARMKADTEFDKLLALKQEYQKLKQELTAFTVTSTAEPLVRSMNTWPNSTPHRQPAGASQ